MSESNLKTARLEARIPEPVRDLLRQAAALQGRSLSEFVVNSAREAAERAIADHSVLRLAKENQLRFAEQLLKPAKPAAALKRAAKPHAGWIESD